MFFTLLAKEIRQHLLTFRFAAALVTIFFLITVSVWILADDYTRRRDTYNIAAEKSAQRDREEVYVPAQISPTLHRPPSPLSLFAQGEDRRLGNSVQIRRWTVPRQAAGSFTDNKLMASLPSFDLLTIFTIVISLFGILFTYDAVTGERETGTLKMLCTGRWGRGSIYTAKFFAGVICLAIPFLLAFVCCVLLLSFAFQISFSAQQWTAIGFMALVGLIYGALFIAVGLLCSVFVRRSSTALVLALLLWALGVLIIPSSAQNTAASMIELPDPRQVSKLEREMQREIVKELMEFRRKHPGTGSGTTGGWGGESYFMFNGRPENFWNTVAYVRFSEPRNIKRGATVWEFHQKHIDKMEQQAEMASVLASAAPAHHLRQAFTRLAGTGIAGYDQFLEECRRYRSEMISEFQRRGYFKENALSFFSRRKKEEITEEHYQKQREDFRKKVEEIGREFYGMFEDYYWGPLPSGETPRFSFQPGEPDLDGAMMPTAFLVFGIILLFAAGFVSFIRYDVR